MPEAVLAVDLGGAEPVELRTAALGDDAGLAGAAAWREATGKAQP